MSVTWCLWSATDRVGSSVRLTPQAGQRVVLVDYDRAASRVASMRMRPGT